MNQLIPGDNREVLRNAISESCVFLHTHIIKLKVNGKVERE